MPKSKTAPIIIIRIPNAVYSSNCRLKADHITKYKPIPRSGRPTPKQNADAEFLEDILYSILVFVFLHYIPHFLKIQHKNAKRAGFFIPALFLWVRRGRWRVFRGLPILRRTAWRELRSAASGRCLR